MVEWVSSFHPLKLGDVALRGTPIASGVRVDGPVHLESGDVVGVEMSGVGLRSTV